MREGCDSQVGGWGGGRVVCSWDKLNGLTSGQLVISSFQTTSRLCFSHFVLYSRGGDRIYEMRCPFVAVGLNALFIVLPHWDIMS